MEKPPSSGGTRGNPIALACIVEVSYRLRPVGPGPLSQCPSRSWTLVSVSISGLPLSRPVPVKGLVSRYLTNCLIGRSPVLRRVHKHGVLTFRRDT